MAEPEQDDHLADEEAQAAGEEAAHIGGEVPSEEGLDPAQRPLVESGEGVAEGFELAEEDSDRARKPRRSAVGEPRLSPPR